MSYDLTIRSDEAYSRTAPRAAVEEAVARLPYVVPNGERGFVLDDPPERWMEIDLEVVNADGDNVEEDGEISETINCIRLHIPYSFLGDRVEDDYLPTALKIAEHLGWDLYDDQADELLVRPAVIAKPWWKLW